MFCDTNKHNRGRTLLIGACLISLMLMAVPARAVIVINDQLTFATYLQVGFSAQVGSPDYRLLNPNQDNDPVFTYQVPYDSVMRIADDVVFDLEPNVEIKVVGRMTNSGVGAQQIVFERAWNGDAMMDPWASITIWGDANVGNNHGVVDLKNAKFTGGGAGDADNAALCCWSGLIVMDGEEGDRPELILTDGSILEFSAHNGIVGVTDRDNDGGAGCIDGLYLHLADVYINNGDEGQQVAECGIKIGDYLRLNPEAGGGGPSYIYNLDNDILIVSSEIMHCGLHGFFAHYSEGTNVFQDSKFNTNGWRDDIDVDYYHPVFGDQAHGHECGIIFESIFSPVNYHGDNYSGLISITGCEASHNRWDGIRIRHTGASTEILNTTLDGNQCSGLFYDYSALVLGENAGEGGDEFVRLEDCSILNNYWDGSFFTHGGLVQVPLDIARCQFTDNQSDLTDFDDQDRGGATWGFSEDAAGIRLYGSIVGYPPDGFPIIENVIRGGGNGISVVHNNPEFGPQESPAAIAINNNLLFRPTDAEGEIAGIRITEYDFNRGDILMFNNTIYGYNYCIYTSLDCPNRGIQGDDGWIQNNIITNAYDIGINDEAPGSPDLPFNCFYDNGPNDVDHLSGCDFSQNNNNIVDLDPLFVNLNQGVEDLRLQWLSPCINMGNPDGDFDDADHFPTDNDIGVTGGPEGGILGIHAMNVATDAHVTTNLVLEPDDYEIATAFEVNANHSLTVNAGTAFFVRQGVTFKISGSLTVDAWDAQSEDREVLFTNYPGDGQWSQLRIYDPTADCDINGMYLSQADLGLWGRVPANHNARTVTVTNSVIDSCGDQCLHAETKIKFQCEDSYFGNATNKGIQCWDNSDYSSFTRCDFKHNGKSGGTPKAGVHIYTSSPTFLDCEVTDSYNWGVLMVQSSLPKFDGKQIGGQGPYHANLIYNNGIGVTQGNADGAEVYCTSSSFPPTFQYNNVYDVTGNPLARHGKIISKDGSQGTFNFVGGTDQEMNYWGDALLNDDADQDDDFYSAGGAAITVGDQDGYDRSADVNDTQNEQIIDGAEDIDAAMALYADGDFAGAYQRFGEITQNPSSVGQALIAMDYLLRCTVNGSLDFSDLRDFYAGFAQNQAEENSDLSWVATKYSCRALYWAGETEQSLYAYRSILTLAPSEPESLLVEMDTQLIECEIEGDLGDSYRGEAVRIKDLEKKYFDALDLEQSSGQYGAPVGHQLVAAYPNPFNPSVTISFALPQASLVQVAIYDSQGRLVDDILRSELNAGMQRIKWNPTGAPSGVYWCKIKAQGIESEIRLLLVR